MLVDHGVYYENVRIAKNIVVGSRFLVDGDLTHRAKTIVDGSRARNKRRGSTITISGPCDTNCVVIGLTIRGGTGTVIDFHEDPPFRFWVAGGGIVVQQAGARILLNHLTQNHIVPIDTFENICGAGLAAGDETVGRSLPPLIIVERNLVADNSLTGGRSEASGISVGQPAVIRDNIIERNHARSLGRAPGGGIGAFFTGPYDILIDRNIIRANVAGIAGGIVLGIPLTQRGRAIISNNIIAENVAYEVGGAANLGEGSWGIFINNTIVGNRAGASGGAISIPTGSSATLVNNIIWANGPDPISNWSETRLIHNIIQGGYPGWMNVSVDPLFIPGDSMYRLSPESPAIGLGLDTLLVAGDHYSILTTDLLNRLRPAGIQPDLGAIEHTLSTNEASEDLRRSWDANRDRRLKFFITFRQITPTERSYDGMQTVQAGQMQIGLTVDDTGFIDLSDGEQNPAFTLPPGANVLEVEIRPRGLDGKRRLFSLLRLDGYEHATYSIPRGRGYGFRQYVDLAPRTYTLRFGAADEVGLIDGSNWRAIRIVVRPFWYQRWWAYLIFSVVGASIILLLVRSEIWRLRKEQHLRRLFSQQQLETQEAERKRLASDLHDGLGQDLLVVRNELRQFERDGTAPHEDLTRVSRLVEESVETVREISSNLHPHHLEKLGFCAAIEAMVDRLQRRSGITIGCACDEMDSVVPLESQIHLYRIVQEAVTNIVKHSKAGEATVVVVRTDGRLEATIRDNGTGFEPVAAGVPMAGGVRDAAKGFGLASMAERMRIIGGTMRVDSKPGEGTTIHLILPLTKE